MHKYKNIISVLFIFLFFAGCNSSKDSEPVAVDFNKKLKLYNSREQPNSSEDEVLHFAVSAMISPKQTIVYYQNLIYYVGKKLQKKPHFVQRKTYQEINDMLKDKRIDYAFICTGAFVTEKVNNTPLAIIAVPVINKKTTYNGIVIVKRDNPAQTFDDLKGLRFAFTDPLSFTGYRYPLFMLKKRNSTPDQFFSSYFFTYAHDNSIQAVNRGIADAASVDELIFNYVKKQNPELIKNVKVIHRSDPFGIPPLVSPPGLHPNLDKKVQSILFQMHDDPEGKIILQNLGIDRFIYEDGSIYQNVEEIFKIIEE